MEEATANLHRRKATGNSTLLKEGNIPLKVNTLLHNRVNIPRKVTIHLLSIPLNMVATSNNRHLHKGIILLKVILNKGMVNPQLSRHMDSLHRLNMVLPLPSSNMVLLRLKWDTAMCHLRPQLWATVLQLASTGTLDQKPRHCEVQ